MKKQLLIFFGLLLIFSCSKKENDNKIKKTRIKKITYYSFNNPKTFEVEYENEKINLLRSDDTKIEIYYDNSGKISEKRIVSTISGEINWKYKFEYQGNVTYETITEYLTNSEIINKREIYYNTQNQIDSVKIYNDTNTLSEIKVFTWQNANLTNIKTFDSNNTLLSNLDIQYDLNAVNKFNEEYSNFWLINEYDNSYNFELYISKNITKSSHYVYNGITEENIYNYSFQNNYVSKIYLNSDLLIEFKY